MQIAEARELLLAAMQSLDKKYIANDLGYIQLRPSYVQQRLNVDSLRLHKPDWYAAFCKTVAIPETLNVILIE